MKHRRLAALAAFALTAVPNGARADTPPGDGLRFVGFHFRIEDAEAFGDWSMVAYPCSRSSGAPIDTYAVVTTAGVDVERRGGPCTLYAVKSAAWRAFSSSQPRELPHGERSAFAEFFQASPDVRRCDLAPSLRFTLPEEDPRQRVEETLRVATLSDTGCRLTRVEVAPPANERSGRRGCSACAAGHADPVAAGLLSVLAAAATLRRRSRA